MQVDMVLEKQLRALHLDSDPQAVGRMRLWVGNVLLEASKPTLETHFFQQGHHTSQCFQIMPLPGDQALKYMRLWGHSYSNIHSDTT